MRKLGVCLALTGATVWLTGCGMQFGSSTSSSRGGLAVVDLDKVAAETGKKLEMDEAYELQRNSVSQQLLKLQNDTNSVLQAKAKELGEEPTDAAKQEVTKMTLNARNNFAQVQNVAGQKLSEYKQVQIAKFRNEIKTILQESAAKRGLSVVIPKNDGLLLAVDPGVDITDDVIKAYNAKRPAPTAAPAAQAPAAPAKQADTAAKQPAKQAAKEKAVDTEKN